MSDFDVGTIGLEEVISINIKVAKLINQLHLSYTYLPLIIFFNKLLIE